MFCRGLLLFAACGVTSVFADARVTSAYYVSDSLMAMYDAIDNQGVGVHDGSATTWKDLSGNGYDFEVCGNGAWSDDAFYFNGVSAKRTGLFPRYRTQEIYCNVESGRWVFLGSGGYSSTSGKNELFQGLVTTSGNIKQLRPAFTPTHGSTKWLSISSYPCTTSVTYGPEPADGSSGVFLNGSVPSSLNGSTYWTENDGDSYIGGINTTQSTYDGKGYVKSIRLYTRELTAGEIYRNRLVDSIRFEGVVLPEPLEPSLSISAVVGGEVGEAWFVWRADSFGFLADSLSGVVVETSENADFASVEHPAVKGLALDGGLAAVTGLAAGSSLYLRVVGANRY